ncbi:MAG: PD-(D/E)XK nuclease family protein [Dehalococcoidia bacterium]|nr:PD-(D/E)XK nuclease family protein [Dehalococcoidia bacterium]MDP7469926.1 PD-(D/E)XK nuclease family protein [Dehalococcoidia bacterium]
MSNAAGGKSVARPLRLSPTSVAVFKQCRYQYKLRYIDKLRDQYTRAKPYLTMANHVHATLRDFLSRVPPDRRTLDMAEALLRGHWRRSRVGFRGEADEQRWANKALAQVKAFTERWDVTVQPLLVEKGLEAQLGSGIALYAKADRVDREADGGLHLVDYKTGNKPPETDWTQLYLQALVLSCRQLAPVSRASFLYLGPSTMETTTVSQDVLDGAMWELLNTAHKILQERKYRATPGTWCGYCDFTPICTARGGEDPASSTPEGQLKLWDYTLEDAD